MTRQTDNAARAVRNVLKRAINQQQQLGEYGIVRRVSPLEVELVGSDDVVDSDELIVTQAVRQYDRDSGLKVGDTLTLVQMDGGDLVAVGVISDTALHDNEVTKDYVQNVVGDSVPPGVIWPSGRASLPSGWLACNGGIVSRTTYARLFGAISTQFGVGDGSTTFGLPDLRGRVPVGTGTGDAADATAHAMGQKLGTEGHTLTTAQLPAHDHSPTANGLTGSTTPADTGSTTPGATGASTVSGSTDVGATLLPNAGTAGTVANPGHLLIGSQWGSAISAGVTAYNNAGSATNHSHTFTNQGSHTHTSAAHTHTSAAHTHALSSVGSDSAHPNMQPYLAVAFMIKV